MNESSAERRKYPRRPMELPVVFVGVDDNNMPGEYFLGEIRNASVGGIGVAIRKKSQFKKGDRFLIYIHSMSKTTEEPEKPVQIRAELVWQDREHLALGMKITNSTNFL